MVTASQTFKRKFTRKNLHCVYSEQISKTAAVGIDRINRHAFESRLTEEIGVIWNKANNGTYRFSQYKERLISKGAEKPPRVISIPTFRDRIVLRALCEVFQNIFEDSISQKIPQMVIADIKQAISTGEYSHFIKVDVEKFYPSIDHGLLIHKLKGKIRKESILKLIHDAISNATVPFADKQKCRVSKGVPQGLSISNILAEIYLNDFDKVMQANENYAYFRYVDDVLVLCKSDPESSFKEIADQLKNKYKLTVHPLAGAESKSRIGAIDEPFSFLGYQFLSRRALVKKESVARLEDSLANIFTTYKYRLTAIKQTSLDKKSREQRLETANAILMWRLNMRITGCVFENARKGWVFYFSQIDEASIQQLWKLDKTVKNLFCRFGVAPGPRKVKTFVRTFFEARCKQPTASGYIPNFDDASSDEQRNILASYFGVMSVDYLSDTEVKNLFNIKIRRATAELEQDIQEVS
jgi:RNA-directed DNA polymerase